jgi:hypothetical protein
VGDVSDDQIDVALASAWTMAAVLVVAGLLWLPVLIYPAAVMTLLTGGGLLIAGRRT